MNNKFFWIWTTPHNLQISFFNYTQVMRCKSCKTCFYYIYICTCLQIKSKIIVVPGAILLNQIKLSEQLSGSTKFCSIESHARKIWQPHEIWTNFDQQHNNITINCSLVLKNDIGCKINWFIIMLFSFALKICSIAHKSKITVISNSWNPVAHENKAYINTKNAQIYFIESGVKLQKIVYQAYIKTQEQHTKNNLSTLYIKTYKQHRKNNLSRLYKNAQTAHKNQNLKNFCRSMYKIMKNVLKTYYTGIYHQG